MPRNFSLARLMIGVTLFCVVCAVAAYYGKEFLAFVFIASLFVPTGIVVLTLVSFSKRRITTMVVSILGAIVSVFFMPAAQHMGAGPQTVWEAIFPELISFAIFPPVGALALGGAALADERFSHRDAEEH